MRALTDGKTSIGAQLFPDRKRPAICVQTGDGLDDRKEIPCVEIQKIIVKNCEKLLTTA